MTTQTPYHGYTYSDNPNSGYWYRRACDNSHQLVALVGQKRALNQMLRVMKDGDTWETTACRLAGLVIQAKAEQAPECSCVLPEQSCPVCQAAARVAHPLEQQF